MLFYFTVPYYTHYYTYEIMMKVLRSPSSPMDFAGHLTQKHRKSTAKTLKAHYNGIGFWWYNRMYSMVFPYIPMIFWYVMSILFAWCSNDLHIFGVFRGPVAFEPTKILGGWNFCRCGILYATCTERGTGRRGHGMWACGGEWWLVGHVIFVDVFWVFQNWVNPLWCSMFQTRYADSKTELDLRKPQRYFDKMSCLSFLGDHSSCPLLFSNSNSGIWIWEALRKIAQHQAPIMSHLHHRWITLGPIKPHSPAIKKSINSNSILHLMSGSP